VDTKFGVDIGTGAAEAAVRVIAAEPSLELRGFHAHIGSQIRELEPYGLAIDRVFVFAKEMRDRHGVNVRELSPGGGYGVRYTPGDIQARPVDLIRGVSELLAKAAATYGLTPEVTIEPGRSIIATSAIALYRVGSLKEIAGVRTYVAIDGGMADNMRPTAYGAVYTALLANRVADRPEGEYAIAGKYCETGDVLIQKVQLPRPRVGDLVAIPASGAYQLSMSSNYNMAPRPAVVTVAEGRSRLVRRRETYDDLLAPESPE
jgi:diaminopimelate decarboxylase